MRSYQAGLVLPLMIFQASSAVAAPSRSSSQMSPAPVVSPAPPMEIRSSLQETPTEELLRNQAMPKASTELFPESLPEALPEDQELEAKAPPASRRHSAPPKVTLEPKTAPEAAEVAPASGDSAADLAPEASTEIPGSELTTEANPEGGDFDLDTPATPEEGYASGEESGGAVVAETPTEEPSRASSGTSTRRWQRGIPRYDQERPGFAIQFAGSLQAFGNGIELFDADTGETSTYEARHFGIGLEFQPKILQSAGVFAFGGSVNIYPLDPQGDLTNGPLDIWSLGGSVKYQAHFLRGQWIVPYVGYEAHWLNYQFIDVESGTTMLSGPVFGALLLLNWMEPEAAYNLYSDAGIKRSYLFGEVRNLTSEVSTFTNDTPGIYFGLRMEM